MNYMELHKTAAEHAKLIGQIPYNVRFEAYELKFIDTRDNNVYGHSYHTSYEILPVKVYRDEDEHPHNGSPMNEILYADSRLRVSNRLFLNQFAAKEYAETIIKDEYRKFKESVIQFTEAFSKFKSGTK